MSQFKHHIWAQKFIGPPLHSLSMDSGYSFFFFFISFFFRKKISIFIPKSWPNQPEQNEAFEMEYPPSKQYNLEN